MRCSARTRGGRRCSQHAPVDLCAQHTWARELREERSPKCRCGCRRHWQYEQDVECVSCPDCGLLFSAMTRDVDRNYSCPACGHGKENENETLPAL